MLTIDNNSLFQCKKCGQSFLTYIELTIHNSCISSPLPREEGKICLNKVHTTACLTGGECIPTPVDSWEEEFEVEIEAHTRLNLLIPQDKDGVEIVKEFIRSLTKKEYERAKKDSEKIVRGLILDIKREEKEEENELAKAKKGFKRPTPDVYLAKVSYNNALSDVLVALEDGKNNIK